MENTREIAATTLYAITEDGAYANLTLGNALRKSHLDQRDKSFVTNLVYGTLELFVPLIIK